MGACNTGGSKVGLHATGHSSDNDSRRTLPTCRQPSVMHLECLRIRSSSSGPIAWMYFTAAQTPGRPAKSFAAPAPQSAARLTGGGGSTRYMSRYGGLALPCTSFCHGTCWWHWQAVRVLRQRPDELQGRIVLAARPQQRHQLAVAPRRSKRRPASLQSGVIRCEARASARQAKSGAHDC